MPRYFTFESYLPGYVVQWVLVLQMAIASSVVAQESRFGQPVQPVGPFLRSTYGLLTAPPRSEIVAPGRLRITFNTVEPTPPAMLYYGINDVSEQLDYPRYRESVAEAGEFPGLRTAHTIEFAFTPVLDRMTQTAFENRICWRVEVYLPRQKSCRAFEGRNYFDPTTKGDTVNITYGPVVEQVTNNTLMIILETDRDCPASVQIGDRVYASNHPAKNHEIFVADLEPNRRYTYHVTAGQTKVRPYTFKTAGAESFSFAAMVDSREGVGGGMQNFGGVNGFSLYALATDAYHRGADFMMFPGDLINGYTTSVVDFQLQLNAFRQMFAPVHAQLPVYESMGNHEALIDRWRVGQEVVRTDKLGNQSSEAVFASVFHNPINGPQPETDAAPTYDENVYYFDYSSARVFMLNNNYWFSDRPTIVGGNLEGYIMPKQMDWLRQHVRQADQDDDVKHLFFAAQEPPFPNGGHTKDSMWYYGGDTSGDKKLDDQDIKIIENRNELWEIVASSPKSVAFITGDEHAYSRLIVRRETDVGHKRKADGSEARFQHDIWQVTSGGAGAPWYDKELNLPWSGDLKRHSTQPHYAFFRVDGPDVYLSAYSQTGEQIDIAVLRKNGVNETQ